MRNNLDNLAVFVVSLEHATKRRKNIQQQLSACGISFKFIDATDDSKPLNAEEFELFGTNDLTIYRERLAPGALGCLISHLRIHKEILASSIPHALILEDDAKLSPDFRNVIGAILAENRKWNLLQIGWSTAQPLPYIGRRTFPLNLFSRHRLNLEATEKQKSSSSNRYYIGPVVATIFCTHSYLISRTGCEYLLAEHRKFVQPYDDLFNFSGLPGRFALIPTITSQNIGDGNILYSLAKTQKIDNEEQEEPGQMQEEKEQHWEKDNGFSGILYNCVARIYSMTPLWFSRLVLSVCILTLTKPLGYYKFRIAKVLSKN